MGLGEAPSWEPHQRGGRCPAVGHTHALNVKSCERCSNTRATPSWPGEGATHGKCSPDNSALLKTLQPPRLCTLRFQKQTFLHLAPPEALQGGGVCQIAAHYAGTTALPREPGCARALSSRPAWTPDLLLACKKSCLGFPQLLCWSQDRPELSASLKLARGDFWRGLVLVHLWVSF